MSENSEPSGASEAVLDADVEGEDGGMFTFDDADEGDAYAGDAEGQEPLITDDPEPSPRTELRPTARPSAQRPAVQRAANSPAPSRPRGGALGGGVSAESLVAGIGLLNDVPLEVTVEIGRRRMSVGDVLALGPSSVVELDKAAGDPLDLLVNGVLVARGEAVVVNDRFGVRLTSLVNSDDGTLAGSLK